MNNFNINLSFLANEVLKHLDIVEAAEKEGLVLSKQGKNYFSLCPFHSERTSSFSINPKKQIFYCFGCGTGGNAIHLISRLHGVSKGKVIYQYARKLGLINGNRPSKNEQNELKQKVIDYEFSKHEMSNFNRVYYFLCNMVHAYRRSMKQASNWREVKAMQHFYQIYDKLPEYEDMLDCMLGNHGDIAQVEAYLTAEEVMKQWNFRMNN